MADLDRFLGQLPKGWPYGVGETPPESAQAGMIRLLGPYNEVAHIVNFCEAIRVGFQDLGHLLLETGWKLTICLCRDDLVTCAAPGFCVWGEKQCRGDAEDCGQFIHRGSRILPPVVGQSKSTMAGFSSTQVRFAMTDR
jgi:hypothetical protein